MAIICYLAMTAAEFFTTVSTPPHMGWMACHFSSSGPGLSNLPSALPPHSLLLADDSTPFHGHDIEVISAQLEERANALQVRSVLLDFQRQNQPEVEELVAHLQNRLPCSVIAPPWYAPKDAPVFLPPAPLYQPLEHYLAPYQNREIWLDAAPLAVEISVTERKCTYSQIPLSNTENLIHHDNKLHCHYGIQIDASCVRFTLGRTQEDFLSWLDHAQALGVTAAVGLYQEFAK